MSTDAARDPRFRTFLEINLQLNSEYSEPQRLLQTIVDAATKLTRGDASSLLLLNEENDRLYFEIATGSKADEIRRVTLAKGEGIAGWVAESQRPIIVNDPDHDPRFAADIGRQVGYRAHSILAAPMRIHDRTVGVIEVLNKQGTRDFTEDDLLWLEAFANQAALAVMNARSFSVHSGRSTAFASEEREDHLVHEDPASDRLVRLVDRVAAGDSAVIILGESGVGKELVATRIHAKSRRASGPLVRVNCAAIPESLLESELFGHEKGAFTDATVSRRGRFELAHGGTLFLDEIGEISLSVQAKLLRVLEEHAFEPLGSSRTIRADVRVLTATNRNLEAEVDQGRFRRDLYYRLNVFPVHVPPLRERRLDIPKLADHFLRSFSAERATPYALTPGAMDTLLSYGWPGNVRELRNALERATVLAEGTDIGAEALQLPIHDVSAPSATYDGLDFRESVLTFKRHLIRHALARHDWNQRKAAETLGIQRSYLNRLIHELDVSR